MTTRNKAERIFRPSILPKLESCIHFQSKKKETPATKRGNDLHSPIAAVLEACSAGIDSALATLEEIPEREIRETAAWVLTELTYERPILIKGAEVEFDLVLDGKTIWKPTIDGYGFDDADTLWGWDYKSGDERDYSAQYAAYAWLLMQKFGRKKMVFAEFYLDLRKINEYEITLEEARDRVLSLWYDFNTPHQHLYKINEYCEYCSLRGNGCPAWEAEADYAITTSAELGVDPVSIAELKANPERLGKFYVAYKRLIKLVEDEWNLKESIHEHLQNKRDVPGCMLARDRSFAKCDVEKVLNEIVPVVGTNRAQTFLEVHATKMQEVWASFTKEPFPAEKVGLTTFSPETYHVRLAGAKGRGKAALARKERAALESGPAKQ